MLLKLVSASLLFVANGFAPLRSLPIRSRESTLTTNMGKMDVAFEELDGSKCRIGIITTRWNKEIIDSLKSGITESLNECNVEESNIFETEVPGAFELPLAARFLALSGTVDAIVCVGCLIKGDTQHFEYISTACANGCMNVGIQTSTPVVYGVLNVNTEEQANDRAFGADNHGLSWGKTAVEMALLRQQALGKGIKGKGLGESLGFGKSTAVGDKGSTPAKEGIGF